MELRAITTFVLISGWLVMLAACGGTGETGSQEDRDGSSSSTTEQGRWSTAAPLPTPRSETAVAQTDNAMYVIGGYTPQTKSSTLTSAYDPATDAWTELAPLPKGLNHIAATSAGGKIYAFGGFTAQNRNAVDSAYVYDPGTDAWSALPSLLTPRGSAGAVALDGKLHVIGGRNDVTDNGDVGAHEVYDPATDTWSKAAPLPTPRDHLAIDVYNGMIHVIGGRFRDMEHLTGVHEVYDPDTDTWGEAAALPTPRSGVATAVINGRILVMGGEHNPTSATGTFEENEAYDPDTDTWSTLAPLPTPRHGFGAAVFDDAVYTPGGAPTNGGSQQSDVNEVFTLTS
jgi:N-acetylneuraminic acid mutarotase